MEVRITKYDPAMRGKNNEFLGDGWTSVTDIDRYPGLSQEAYLDVEIRYWKVLRSMFRELKIDSLQIFDLETHHYSDDPEDNALMRASTEACRKIDPVNGMHVKLTEFNVLFEAAMRSVIWFRGVGAYNSFVHFGYDYYLYFGSDRSFSWQPVKGIFVEDFTSPYHQEDG